MDLRNITLPYIYISELEVDIHPPTHTDEHKFGMGWKSFGRFWQVLKLDVFRGLTSSFGQINCSFVKSLQSRHIENLGTTN